MQVTNLNGAIKQITVGGVNYSLTGSSYMGTTAEWNNSSHKPAHGELIIYNDNGKIQFKIGDGTTLAKSLAFVEMGNDVPLERITEAELDEICVITSSVEERLEGDGQEFYTMAPSALSFRSTAPLNELQDIQINGTTVDPSNYELEEGSTIVKLKHDYLSTLGVGQYELSVISDSKTAKGDFIVAAPELNEYGFYYNQPYYAEIAAAEVFNFAIVFSSDNTAMVLDFNNSEIQTMEYQYNQEKITFTIPSASFMDDGAPFQGKFSQDGTALSGILDIGMWGGEMDTIFEIGQTIFSDEMYVYYLSSWGGYEDKLEYIPIDRTLPVYSIVKDNILGIPVEVIGQWAFVHNELLTEINLPRTIKFIAAEAFGQCSSLTSVTLPDGVVGIALGAFRDCTSLTNITFEGTVEQWNVIDKDVSWNLNVPATYVQCSDGTVNI